MSYRNRSPQIEKAFRYFAPHKHIDIAPSVFYAIFIQFILINSYLRRQDIAILERIYNFLRIESWRLNYMQPKNWSKI